MQVLNYVHITARCCGNVCKCGSPVTLQLLSLSGGRPSGTPQTTSQSMHAMFQSLMGEIIKLCLDVGTVIPSTACFGTLQDRPMRPELLWTHQPMTQGKGQNKVTHWQAAL